MSDQVITLRLLREPEPAEVVTDISGLAPVSWEYLDTVGVLSGGLDSNDMPVATNNGSGVLDEDAQPSLMDMLSYINQAFEDGGQNYRLIFDSFSEDESDCLLLNCRVVFMDLDEQERIEVTIDAIRKDLYLYLVDGFNGYDVGVNGNLQFDIL